MAKKSFKKGIGNLIEESVRHQQEEQDQAPQEGQDELEKLRTENKRLREQLNLMKEELWHWRTGRLSTKKFQESLAQHNLHYSEAKNNFEEI